MMWNGISKCIKNIDFQKVQEKKELMTKNAKKIILNK